MLSLQLDQIQAENVVFRRENAALRQQNVILREENAVLREENAKLLLKIAEMNRRLDRLEAIIAKQDEDLEN